MLAVTEWMLLVIFTRPSEDHQQHHGIGTSLAVSLGDG
jgi:hypothetical protein